MMNRILILSKTLAPAFLSGLMIGTSYIPYWPWALAFCYLPLWWDITRDPKATNLKLLFFKAWITQTVLTLIGFYWISFVAHEFGFLPKPAAYFVLFIFSALSYLYIPVSATLALWISQKWQLQRWTTYLLLPLLLGLLEQVWPVIFKWHLGYTLLYAQLPAFQLADYIGFQGFSLLILVSQGVFLIILRTPYSVLKKVSLASLVLIAWLLINLLGQARAQHIAKLPSDTITFGLVQANIGNLEKYLADQGRGYQKAIIDKYFNLSVALKKRAQDLEFIIWPEAAIPEFLDEVHQDRKYSAYFHQRLKELQVPLITGAYSSDPLLQIPRRDFNALFTFDEQGLWTSPPYRKTHLLIFGEYLPFSETFPILKKYNPAGSGFSKGNGPQVMHIGEHKFGAQLCYESLDPFFSTRLKQLGADFILNVTNDSWFGPTSEPIQHMYMTLARAIETRLPLIRATNTGISIAIDNLGQMTKPSPQGQEWIESLNLKIYRLSQETFYTQWGIWLPWINLLVIIFLIRIGRLCKP